MTQPNPAPATSTSNAAPGTSSPPQFNVLIALPTYDNSVHFDFAMALARLMETFKERGVHF